MGKEIGFEARKRVAFAALSGACGATALFAAAFGTFSGVALWFVLACFSMWLATRPSAP